MTQTDFSSYWQNENNCQALQQKKKKDLNMDGQQDKYEEAKVSLQA